MRTRFLSLFLALAAALLLLAPASFAAPEAKILRIDPRAGDSDGAPILTTVIELVQNKRMSDAIAECASLRGDAQLDCQSERLEAPQALYTPLAPFPEGGAIFTVSVDGTDMPAKFVSKARWGESLNQKGVGTAWLILVDAASSMGPRFSEAKAIAEAFVSSMTPADIVNVVFFNDRQVVADSKWQAASAKGKVQEFIKNVSTYPVQGRVRPLFSIVKQAATDSFKDLGNVGGVEPPLHQAMVVLSNGVAGTDPLTTGAGALQLSEYLTKGRFPEDNTVQPKMPVPVISVWLPAPGYDEFKQNAREFMQNLANPQIGGLYTIARTGQGAAKGPKIVQAVRTRFNQMHIVKWRVSCVAPSLTQTFKLVFTNTTTPILGDSTFKDVPVGIDPTTWPLDINVEYTKQMADRSPVEPGGKLKVYGDFCWGGDQGRAEVYFIPAGTEPPPSLSGTDIESARRAQQQLIASGMRGKVIQTSDSDVEFEAPDSAKILSGSGDAMNVRVVVYDNKARRASGVTAATVLTLKAKEKSLPVLMIVGGAFGVVVLALLVVIVLRSGGNKRRSPAAAPAAPVVAAPPMGGGYGASPGYAHAPSPAPTPGAAPAPQADFMYGGQPPQYGLTSGHPAVPPAPPDPYAPPVSRATLTGPEGTYTVLPGFEMKVGRDGTQCQIVLTEPRISGVHASFKVEGGAFFVRDEGSNNGTFVNGNRLPPGVWTPVGQGSALKLGPVELGVRLE